MLHESSMFSVLNTSPEERGDAKDVSTTPDFDSSMFSVLSTSPEERGDTKDVSTTSPDKGMDVDENEDRKRNDTVSTKFERDSDFSPPVLEDVWKKDTAPDKGIDVEDKNKAVKAYQRAGNDLSDFRSTTPGITHNALCCGQTTVTGERCPFPKAKIDFDFDFSPPVLEDAWKTDTEYKAFKLDEKQTSNTSAIYGELHLQQADLSIYSGTLREENSTRLEIDTLGSKHSSNRLHLRTAKTTTRNNDIGKIPGHTQGVRVSTRQPEEHHTPGGRIPAQQPLRVYNEVHLQDPKGWGAQVASLDVYGSCCTPENRKKATTCSRTCKMNNFGTKIDFTSKESRQTHVGRLCSAC